MSRLSPTRVVVACQAAWAGRVAGGHVGGLRALIRTNMEPSTASDLARRIISFQIDCDARAERAIERALAAFSYVELARMREDERGRYNAALEAATAQMTRSADAAAHRQQGTLHALARAEMELEAARAALMEVQKVLAHERRERAVEVGALSERLERVAPAAVAEAWSRTTTAGAARLGDDGGVSRES